MPPLGLIGSEYRRLLWPNSKGHSLETCWSKPKKGVHLRHGPLKYTKLVQAASCTTTAGKSSFRITIYNLATSWSSIWPAPLGCSTLWLMAQLAAKRSSWWWTHKSSKRTPRKLSQSWLRHQNPRLRWRRMQVIKMGNPVFALFSINTAPAPWWVVTREYCIIIIIIIIHIRTYVPWFNLLSLLSDRSEVVYEKGWAIAKEESGAEERAREGMGG